MEFTFQMIKVMKIEENGITIIDGSKKTQKYQPQTQFYVNNQYRSETLDTVIDIMGEASAKAQGLKQVITLAHKFYGTDQKLYLKVEGNKCQGLLKIGPRNLFHRDATGAIKELKPMCVLDFYVHESVQRNGIGKVIFEAMLQDTGLDPSQLAYDRPSSKLLAFLRKHYNLINYIPQNNNYVIYNQYFTSQNNGIQRNQNIQDKIKNQENYSNKQSQPNGSKGYVDPPLQNQINNDQNLSLNGFNNEFRKTQDINKLNDQFQQLNLSDGKNQSNQYNHRTTLSTPWATNLNNPSQVYQTTSKQMSQHVDQKRTKY